MRSYMEMEVVGFSYFDDEMTDKDTGQIKKINSGKIFGLGGLDGRFNKPGRSMKAGRSVMEQRMPDSAFCKLLEMDGRVAAGQAVSVRLELQRVTNGKGGQTEVVVGAEIVPAQAVKVAKAA